MLRVSLSTSSFSERTLLNPRELIAQELALCCATCRPGTSRSASGRLVAPERRMCSLVTTAIAAAAPPRVSAVLETEVTLTSMSSSRLSFLSLSVLVTSCAGHASEHANNPPNSIAIARQDNLSISCMALPSMIVNEASAPDVPLSGVLRSSEQI